MCSARASTCFCEVNPSASVTSKSKSPTVSLPRRSEPAGVTESTPFPAFLMCSAIASAASSAVLIKKRPVDFLKTSTAFRIFCSLFSPNPGTSRSFCSLASLSTSATVAALKFDHRKATFFGPSDCNCSTSRIVAGYFFQQLLAQRIIARLPDLLQLLDHPFADSRQLFELFRLFHELFDRFRQTVNQLSSLFIAAVPADDCAINFQKLRGVAQDSCDLLVVHSAQL